MHKKKALLPPHALTSKKHTHTHAPALTPLTLPSFTPLTSHTMSSPPGA